jgi:uncharacterized membrane protein YeaQ/YmgE (transglycosylase-associated protein family)
MFIDVVLIGIAVGLAILASFFKRSAGVLILAAMAGALVASVSANTATTWLSAHGLTISQVTPSAVVGAAITIVPAFVCLLVAPKNNAKVRRLIGATVFGIVGATLLAQYCNDIFADAVIQKGHLMTPLTNLRGAILAIGLVVALVDLFLGKGKSSKEKK